MDQNHSEFTVGNFRIDMKRSQIVAQDNILAIQPKVLRVLLLLAKHQGQVVTHDQILDFVWSKTEVEANTIQRCVAQLRKAFGDDAKKQTVIATHPKIGYSLLADVDWHNSPEVAAKASSQSHKISLSLLSCCLLLLLATVAVYLQLNKSAKLLPTGKIKVLTQTDNKESAPIYSPDDKYIAFLRHVGECKSHIVALELGSNKEFLLTEQQGIYGKPAWSPDGKTIAFVQSPACDLEVSNGSCKELRAISFAMAKTSPQTSKQLVACDNEHFDDPVWIDDHQLAFFATSQKQTSVKRLKLNEAKSLETLFESETLQPYSLTYIPEHKTIATVALDAKQDNHLILTLIDDLESTIQPLKVPEEFKDKDKWPITWSPILKAFVSSAPDALATISLDGLIVTQAIPVTQSIEDISSANLSTDFVAAKDHLDQDIWSLQLGQNSPSITQNTVARSTASETNAQMQPTGFIIAFLSERTGNRELWIQDTQQPLQTAKQLTHFKRRPISSYIWSQEGDLLYILLENKLHALNLLGESSKIDTDFTIQRVFQALPDGKLLLQVANEPEPAVIEFDLHKAEKRVLWSGSLRWAQVDSAGRLWVTLENAQFRRLDQNKLWLGKGLEQSLSWHKFFIRDNSLWFLDNGQRLRRYDFKNNTLETVLADTTAFHRLSDINTNMNKFIFSQVVRSEREIVMFHH